MKKKYYFPDPTHEEEFFGPLGEWVCMSKKELRGLAKDWGTPFAQVMRTVHEATEEELALYGKSEA